MSLTTPEKPGSGKRYFLRLVLLVIAVTVIAALASFFLGRRYILEWSVSPGPLQETAEIVLPRGATLKSFSEQLEEGGFVSDGDLFHFWVRLFNDYSRFQAGRYQFEPRVTPLEIASTIISGEVFIPVVLTLIIPEGFTLRMLAERLERMEVASREKVLALGVDTEFLNRLNVPSSTLEGYLYPATYRFSEIPSPYEALEKIVRTFWSRLPADYEARVGELGLSLNEAVIFASLIELETSREDEKRIVSEVIWNRLRRNMTLGIDASVIYGIEDYEGRLTHRHLRDPTNPYNTRIHGGLPPTAIGSPSLSSLLAVLDPTDYGYLYYVVDANDFTRHRFSRTLAEHNRNVRDLVRAGHGR